MMNQIKDIYVINDFYEEPFLLRERALSLKYPKKQGADRSHPGGDSIVGFFTQSHIDAFSEILGKQIASPLVATNEGKFRYTPKGWSGFQHVHNDANWWVEPNPIDNSVRFSRTEWSAIVYLNPIPEEGTGVQFWKHVPTGWHRHPSIRQALKYEYKSTDSIFKDLIKGLSAAQLLNWDKTHFVKAQFNRLIIFRADLYHSAEPWGGYGTDIETSRLAQLFFLRTVAFQENMQATIKRSITSGETLEVATFAQTLNPVHKSVKNDDAVPL